jgi:hypothetical protein
MKSKGMEMPIQIFITLFVLLAVAMLVLQMVTQQIGTQTNTVKVWQASESFKNAVAKIQSECSDLCSKANSDSSLLPKVNFCTKSFPGGLELTGNAITNEYDQVYLGGVGICEDSIYCPVVTTCKLGGSMQLNMDQCRVVMCQYWTDHKFDDARKKELLLQFWQPGICYNPADLNSTKYHWYTSLFDSSKDGKIDPVTEIKCS